MEHFNRKISHARVTIENSFGILASRWRVLRSDIHAAPETVERIIKATVLLHNFLILTCTSYCPSNYVDRVIDGEIEQGLWRNDDNSLRGLNSSKERKATREAYSLRNKFCRYLFINK